MPASNNVLSWNYWALLAAGPRRDGSRMFEQQAPKKTRYSESVALLFGLGLGLGGVRRSEGRLRERGLREREAAHRVEQLVDEVLVLGLRRGGRRRREAPRAGPGPRPA